MTTITSKTPFVDFEETIEEYEQLSENPNWRTECNDEVKKLQLLESIYEQCLKLGLKPHRYTNFLDNEAKLRINKKFSLSKNQELHGTLS